MSNLFSRFSENALFAMLIVAVVGWTAVSVAADRSSPGASGVCEVARTALTPSPSPTGVGEGSQTSALPLAGEGARAARG